MQTYFYSILGHKWTDHFQQRLTIRTPNRRLKQSGCPAPREKKKNSQKLLTKKRPFAFLCGFHFGMLIYFLFKHTSTSCKKVFYWNSIKTRRYTKHRLYTECDRWLLLKRCFAFGDGDWASKAGPDDNVLIRRGQWRFTSAYSVDDVINWLHLPACVGWDELRWLSVGW